MARCLRVVLLLLIVAILIGNIIKFLREVKDSTHLASEGKIESLRYPSLVHQDGFTLPMPRDTLSIGDLLRQNWMRDLRHYLRNIPQEGGSPISIATSDSKYSDKLYNWLISATVETSPPLSHILILSLDLPLHRTLKEHGFNSVYVDSKALLNTKTQSLVERSSKKTFYTVMVLRLTVMRLLNHWGYDTANYDTDAIILRNPEALYYNTLNTSHLIGSRGRFPKDMKNALGVTLCAGVFMTRSSPETEQFWNTVSKVVPRFYPDDQVSLNAALLSMDLTWEEDKMTFTGRSLGGLRVTIIREPYIYRTLCDHEKKKTKSYYIAHCKHSIIWYLKEDWRNEGSKARGTDWLREMQ